MFNGNKQKLRSICSDNADICLIYNYLVLSPWLCFFFLPNE